jgi:hypothetical protein
MLFLIERYRSTTEEKGSVPLHSISPFQKMNTYDWTPELLDCYKPTLTVALEFNSEAMDLPATLKSVVGGRGELSS